MKKKRSLQSKLLQKPDPFAKVVLKGAMPYLWIALPGLLVYLQSLFFNFVYFDDNVLILDQQAFIRDLSSIIKAFGRDVFATYKALYYRPVYTISLVLNGVIGGTGPFIYHLTNTLIHITVCCLVFNVLVKLKYDKFPALLAALFFTVLPVLTQAVVWIPGRNDLLLMLFVLIAFRFFLDYIEKKRWAAFLLHALFFGLALFTKEIAIALPLLCLFYLQFILKEKLLSKNKLLFLSSWIVLFFLWFILRHFALANPVKIALPEIFKSIFSGLPALVQYLGKILLPFNLAVLPTIQDTTFVYGIITLLLVAVAFIFTKKPRLGLIFFGIGWFFLFLLPSFIYPYSNVTLHYREDRLYVPVLGFILVLMETGPVKILTAKRKTALPVFLGILCLFSVITIMHSTLFKERLVFWESAVRHAPHSPLAHRNLGMTYYDDGRKDMAETSFRKALELNPGEPMAHNNLGAIYTDRHLWQEAISEFTEELKVNPNYDRALFNLGFVYFQLQNFPEAIRYWKEAVRVNPMKLDAYYGLGLAYKELQDKTQAQYYFEEYKKRGGKVQ